MKNFEKFILDIAGKAGSLKKEQVIIGQDTHPRKTTGKYYPTEYIKKFREVTDIFEVAYLVSGKCVMNLKENYYIMKPGDFCFVRQGVKHFEASFDKTLDYEIIWFIYFTVNKLKIIDSCSEKGQNRILNSIDIKGAGKTVSWLEAMYKELYEKDNFKTAKRSACKWLQFIETRLRKNEYSKKEYTGKYVREATLKAKKLEKAVEYIIGNFRKELRLAEIAKQVNLAPAYFCVLFKEVYNQKPTEFITELRLSEATKLLKTTNLNINEIAFKTGFNDPYFFSRVFKKNRGIAPTEFRKNLYIPRTDFSPHIPTK